MRSIFRNTSLSSLRRALCLLTTVKRHRCRARVAAPPLPTTLKGVVGSPVMVPALRRPSPRLAKNILANLCPLCLYEDRVVGRISPERYDFLASGYEQEQTQISTKLDELNDKINEIDMQEKYVKEFIAKAKEYINIEKLTPEILHAFIKRIDVYEKEVRYSRTCGNTIVIQYTFQLDKN